jgi:hypothetical protein
MSALGVSVQLWQTKILSGPRIVAINPIRGWKGLLVPAVPVNALTAVIEIVK